MKNLGKLGLVAGLVVVLGAGCASRGFNDGYTREFDDVGMDPATYPSFGLETYAPTSAKDVQVANLDLDADGAMEKLVTYTVNEVQTYGGARDTVYYLLVYRFQHGEWQVIKEAQKTASAIGEQETFCQAQVVSFENSPKDYVLINKCQAYSGNEGYTVFGELALGIFGDLQIPKAYLYQEKYLTESDDKYLALKNVQVVEDGLVEHYGVACGNPTDYCRTLEVKQGFDGNGFTLLGADVMAE